MIEMTRTGFQKRLYGGTLETWFECPQCGEGVWSVGTTETCDCEAHPCKVWEIGPDDMLTPEEETFLRLGTTSTPDRRSVEL